MVPQKAHPVRANPFSSREIEVMTTRAALSLLIVAAVGVCRCTCEPGADFEQQLHVLSKQVNALLEKRREDVRMIEDNIRRSVYDSPELSGIRDEVKNLRLEVEQLRTGKVPKPHQDKNDRLTVKWIFNTVEELKTEVTELQSTLNSSVILQNHEHVETEFSLLKSDMGNLNSELENARKQNAKYEAELQIFREEFQSIKENWRSTAELCGMTKNQKSSKTLHKENYALKTKLLEMEDEIKELRNVLRAEHVMHPKKVYDRINGNEIENYIETEKIREIQSLPNKTLFAKLLNVTEQQKVNSKSIHNLTMQLTNFDKLHLSTLELLENVETIENRIDKSFPEFRSEISKLEVQVSETSSAVSLLKEDQKNIIESLKAISFTVSTMQDKTNEDHKYLESVDDTVKNLVRLSNVQNSKLHDHILKEESSSVNPNVTKATIHLVQELKSFESEYKSIVNKLPRDCGSVEGPEGIYLISPGDGQPILAHCQDGWTTIQKRYDGSIDFNRDWNEYSNGFGSATGEHWLGKQINIKDIFGKYWQANYADFRVGDYDSGFRLRVERFSGNASDALDYQNGMEFSTVDNDRDISKSHCANNYEGGWWYSHCQHAILNGRYNLGVTWFDSSNNEWIAVSHTEMRVKHRDVC
ncbi:hypothetical protein NQ318_010848 [Aromia moschata]|uniref:Fibrinogen C-terminal domain-containing protein n=1 Tax=Aromia moschata TaxID=1265417 RepID=A0AAV8YJ60_9CUCU|nr:hypothetical protein NQ318_010848 [Aromia moschata]